MKRTGHPRWKPMMFRPLRSLVSLALASALTVASARTGASAADGVQDTTAPPAFVHQALSSANLLGQGQMRFLGLRIYDARLWAGPQFEADNFGAHRLALELTYHRAFTGAAIAQRSLEEMTRQGELTPEQTQRWQQALSAVLPDVQPGVRLTGLYQPGQGMRLWRDNQALGAIDDAELARRFFGIWLSPSTSAPSLRSALLARLLESRS